MSSRLPIISCAASAAIAVVGAGLLGWALMLVLIAMIAFGLVALANEAARSIIRSKHGNGQASRPAGGAEGQG